MYISPNVKHLLMFHSICCYQDIAKFALHTSSNLLKVKAVKVLNAVCGNAAMTLLALSNGKLIVGIACIFSLGFDNTPHSS